jgi:DNA-directed RNA polymerase specialized sigma24 family protein
MDPRDLDRDFLAFRERGSAEALARVFDALAPRLLLVAGHLTRDAARAEDLVQTTFVQAMRDAAGYDGARPVGAWLAGILRHRAEDERRRAQRRAAEPLEAGARALAGGPDPAELAADRRARPGVRTREHRGPRRRSRCAASAASPWLRIGVPETEDPHAMTLVGVRVLDAEGNRVLEDALMASFGAGVERVTSRTLRLAPGSYRVRAELEDGRALEAELSVPRPPDAAPLLLDLR